MKAITLSWLVVLRGVLVISFGIIAITFAIMAIVSAMFIFFFGVLVISFSVPVLAWVVGIAAVVVGLVWPGPATLTLFYFIVAWPIVTGSARATGTLRLRQVIDNKRVLVTGGLFSLASGGLAVIYSGTSVPSTCWPPGFCIIACGVLLLLRDYRSREMSEMRTA